LALAGVLLAALIRSVAAIPWPSALLFAVPIGVLLGSMALPARALARALPVSRTPAARVTSTAAVAAVATSAIWTAIAGLWWGVLAPAGLPDPPPFVSALLLGAGALGYLLAVTMMYGRQAIADSAASARRALELQVAQRDAELRALRAQVDPHFLFNSLNSIAGLTSADPARARQMCTRLAGFLRDSLTLGSAAWIPLAREAALAAQYLDVEQVRFGARLTYDMTIPPECADVPVPPLLLQPVVENAVRHGIATRLEGGHIQVSAHAAAQSVIVVVTNPCDPESRRAGAGMGQELVRRRLAAAYGERASLSLDLSGDAYRVTLLLPPGGVPAGE
jgi:hypothetical protein